MRVNNPLAPESGSRAMRGHARVTRKFICEVNLDIMRTVAPSKLHLISELSLEVLLRLKTL
jgi:hypothetical protein